MKFGFVIATTSNFDATRNSISAAEKIEDGLVGLFPNGKHGSFQGLPITILLNELPHARGSADARNMGAQILMDQGCDWLVFPNHTTTISQKFFDCLKVLNPCAGAGMYLGHYLYGGNRLIKSPLGYVERGTLLSVMEAALVVRSDVFTALGGFERGLGTGSDGILWSGEAADLAIRAFDNGFSILGLDMVIGCDSRDFQGKSFFTEIKYALGHSVVRKKYFPMRENFFSIFFPIISFFTGGSSRSAFRFNIKSAFAKILARSMIFIFGYKVFIFLSNFLANKRKVQKT